MRGLSCSDEPTNRKLYPKSAVPLNSVKHFSVFQLIFSFFVFPTLLFCLTVTAFISLPDVIDRFPHENPPLYTNSPGNK